MPTEREMIEQLRTGKFSLPPLSFRLLRDRSELRENIHIDALLEGAWGETKTAFAVECKSLSTPKAFQDGLNRRNLLVERWDKKTMSLSTVSKGLKTLEEDLIIAREDAIRLLQPDKLLQELIENHVPPNLYRHKRFAVLEVCYEAAHISTM